MGGQSIPVTITTEVKESGNSWIVTDTANMGQGDIVDVVTLEKGSLLLTHRSIKQGPVAIELDFKDNKASGTMSMSGQPQPIAVDLGGTLFADGAGAYDVIGTLPLAEGYSAGFRNLDIQKQKVGLKQLKVLGSESVTVQPPGRFDAFKVEITSADTMWTKQQRDRQGPREECEGQRSSRSSQWRHDTSELSLNHASTINNKGGCSFGIPSAFFGFAQVEKSVRCKNRVTLKALANVQPRRGPRAGSGWKGFAQEVRDYQIELRIHQARRADS